MTAVNELNNYFNTFEDYTNLNTNEDVINIPNLNLTTKESRHNYKVIRHEAVSFDRYFDNTVVDTYAFYKVLHSEAFTNALYYFLYESKYKANKVNEVIVDYTIIKVKEIYQTTHHSLFKPDVYYDYIKQLINRILVQ
jgi:hypothetical protein